MRSSAGWSSWETIVSSGQISSRTKARIQSSCSSNSGSVEKSHAMLFAVLGSGRGRRHRSLRPVASMPAFVPAPDGRWPHRPRTDVPEPERRPRRGRSSSSRPTRSTAASSSSSTAPREGWRPGQDVAGRVERTAADGSGPAPGHARGRARPRRRLGAAGGGAHRRAGDPARRRRGHRGIDARRRGPHRAAPAAHGRQRGRASACCSPEPRAGWGTSWSSWPPRRARS